MFYFTGNTRGDHSAIFIEPQKIGDCANPLVSVVVRILRVDYLYAPRSAFRFLVAAAFLAAADRSARGRAAEAAPPIRPPRSAADGGLICLGPSRRAPCRRRCLY